MAGNEGEPKGIPPQVDQRTIDLTEIPRVFSAVLRLSCDGDALAIDRYMVLSYRSADKVSAGTYFGNKVLVIERELTEHISMSPAAAKTYRPPSEEEKARDRGVFGKIFVRVEKKNRNIFVGEKYKLVIPRNKDMDLQVAVASTEPLEGVRLTASVAPDQYLRDIWTRRNKYPGRRL